MFYTFVQNVLFRRNAERVFENVAETVVRIIRDAGDKFGRDGSKVIFVHVFYKVFEGVGVGREPDRFGILAENFDYYIIKATVRRGEIIFFPFGKFLYYNFNIA